MQSHAWGLIGIKIFYGLFKTMIIKPLQYQFHREKMNNFESSQVDSQPQPQDGQVDRTMGPWSIQENISYVSFLEMNRTIMSSKRKRKQSKIFDQMASFLGTRNALQCRSHHQKLLEKMGDFKVIIKNFKKNVGKKYFKEQYRRCVARTSNQAVSPNIKDEEESPPTERASPQPERRETAVLEASQAQIGPVFQLTDLLYLQQLNNQLLASMMMMPCYYQF